MGSHGADRGRMNLPIHLRLYVGAVALLQAAIIVWAISNYGGIHSPLALGVLVVLFAVSESTFVFFHYESGRQSLSVSEAILFPMLFTAGAPAFILGVTAAMLATRLVQWRDGMLRSIFNVSQIGCSAAGAAGVWSLLGSPEQGFTLVNATAGVAAVITYAILNQIMVMAAVALASGKSWLETLRTSMGSIGLTLALNVGVGLFLAAAFVGADWTVLLFPLALGGLFWGYGAILRQAAERERIEHLHSASRALASSPSFEGAMTEFLKAVRVIASTSSATAVVDGPNGLVWSSVVRGEVIAEMAPLDDSPLNELMDQFARPREPLIVSDDSSSTEHDALLRSLDVGSLIAVPLLDADRIVGCLLAADRLGAGEFAASDARLLEALGHELVLSLDSYRLFAQVTEERERFRRIFEGSKEGICLLDDHGKVRAWNPALSRITGYEAEDLLGRVWSSVLAMTDENHKPIDAVGLVSTPPDQELEITTREGQSRWVSVLSDRTRGANEDSWVVLVRDVTAEHIVEESKSDFLATISHELRTPLTTIKGSVQILGGNQEDQTPLQQQMIKVLERGTERLERLVLNLLFVSQLDVREDVKIFVEDLDLADIARRSVEVIASDHPQVEVVLRQESVPARGDRERMVQVIDHLVENAVKFCPEGVIRVEVGTEEKTAFVIVQDSGPGIPGVDQERIFERFVRLGHVLTRETQGPGVGLFIVKKAIEAMGGTVSLQSRPGEGSSFRITLPMPVAAPKEHQRV